MALQAALPSRPALALDCARVSCRPDDLPVERSESLWPAPCRGGRASALLTGLAQPEHDVDL